MRRVFIAALLLAASMAQAQTLQSCAQGTNYLCTTDTAVTKAGSCIGDAPGDWCGTVNLGAGTPTVLAPIINGASASGGDLKLRSTTHATKGQIEFGAAGTTFYDETNDNWTLNGKLAKYNNVATVSNGIPSIVASVMLAGQTTNIVSGALYTPPADGVYRVTVEGIVTTAAATSSSLGGFSVNYTDATMNTSITPTVVIANSGNTVGTRMTQTTIFYAKGGVAIVYNMGYASSPANTMTYALRIRLEAL